ncbi:MAG: hypothetical protein M0P70_13285 [Desulfobulbaceae bacterium]|nr:hypothetical protein [Desulfobulbaceae bacterium]
MADNIEKGIEELLRKGKSKTEIWEMFGQGREPHKALFYLNNSSLPRDRKKFQLINLLLALGLLVITTKKLITALSFGTLDIFLLFSLVVPVINIYVLREILRFHRIGYQFLFVLSCLALLQPENHHELELFILVLLIGLSGYLHQQMFPVKNKIRIQ